MSKEAKILITIAGVVVIGGVLLAIFANPQPTEPGAPVDEKSLIRDNSHMTKELGAKVTIVEFGDFQCPGCAAAAPIVKQVIETYKDNKDVNFVFRNFPLDSIHPNAHISAEAAEAAAAQGKFWEMYEILYSRQADWSTNPSPLEAFVGYAQSLGLNVDEFRSAVSQRMFADVITADYNDGVSLQVNSTPTFFINGVKEAKVLSFEEFKAKIDAELAKDTAAQPTETPAEPVTQPAN
jgi:protein-disulfide isomerase